MDHQNCTETQYDHENLSPNHKDIEITNQSNRYLITIKFSEGWKQIDCTALV